MDFNFLYKPLKEAPIGELNEKYFRPRDDEVLYTDFYNYKMAQNAKAFFAKKVIALDERDPETGKGKYTYDKEGDFEDKNAIAAAKGPYAQKYLLLNEKWEQYKQSHIDEFEEQIRIENIDSEELNLSEFQPEISCSLEEAIQAYWCAGELLKKYGSGTDDYDKLPKLVAYVSKKENKEKHNNIRTMYREELGIPEEETFKSYIHEVRPQMKGGRHPEATDDSLFEEYSQEFTKFILED